ncbi:MAG TPA: CRTAC1 family protein [Vicinamibacterales bacterium]|nr:CRTAC1 family protein [Vicinamibacterales bacterium]
MAEPRRQYARLVASHLVALLLPAVLANAQTLKSSAPVPTGPASGEVLTTRTPLLTVQNAQGTYVFAQFVYRFEVYDAARGTLEASGVVGQGDGVTGFQLSSPLDYAVTYWWRARAQLDGADGPWSATFSFVTPDPPPPPPPPSSPLSFTDISVASGIAPSVLGGHGVMFGDATGTGQPDLYITMNFGDPQADLFFVNLGDATFDELGTARGIADFDVGSHGAAFADMDNDGDYDLVNGATGAGAPNNIFQNDGQGFFTDATPASMAARAEATRGMVTFDMDGDGDLDIFAVSGFQGSDDPAGERNELYRNNGNLQFTAIESGAAYDAEAGQGVTDTDYDGDGDIDLLAPNGSGRLIVLRNDAGVFTQVTPSGIGIDRDADSGITMADIDTDGDQDMLIVGVDASDDRVGYLFRNAGNGTFTRLREFADFEGFMGGFADLDNDQDLDLVFAGDDVSYLNDGAGVFTPGPAVPTTGIDDPRAIAFADIDGDGDLDFAIGAKRSSNWLVRNNVSGLNWLNVVLISPQGQVGAFGTKVAIHPDGMVGAGMIGMRESRSNNGYLGQDDPTLHFGLGQIDAVTVIATFLDGTIRTVTGVTANQTIIVDGRTANATGLSRPGHAARTR